MRAVEPALAMHEQIGNRAIAQLLGGEERSLASLGRATPLPFREQMERAFGQRLDGISVRVGAPEETAALGAGALTQGDTIVFGQDAPHREAVAHEVAHVVQNRQAKRAARAGVSTPSSGAESEAHDVGKRVGGGGVAGAVSAAPDAAVHRGPLSWLKRKFGRKGASGAPAAPAAASVASGPAAAPTASTPAAPALAPLNNALVKESTQHGLVGQAGSEFSEGNGHWAGWEKKVTYAAKPEDAARYGTTADASTGALLQGGKKLDTTNAKRTVVAGGSGGRKVLGSRGGAIDEGQRKAGERIEGSHMFVMTPEGEFKTADQGAEEDRTGKRVHHSTFQGGGAVAAAGEMIVRDGQVAAISDRSGHYRPSAVQTNQAVNRLEQMGTSPERLHVELGGKGNGEKTIDMTGMEMQGWNDEMAQARAEHDSLVRSGRKTLAEDVLSGPEKKIRAAHAKKDDVLTELKQKTAGRRAQLDGAEPASPAPQQAEEPFVYGDYNNVAPAPPAADRDYNNVAPAPPAADRDYNNVAPAASPLRTPRPRSSGYAPALDPEPRRNQPAQPTAALRVGEPQADGYSRMLDPGPPCGQPVAPSPLRVAEPQADGYARMLDPEQQPGRPSAPLRVAEPQADGYSRMLDP